MTIYFITGTDTNAGKTYVSCKLLEQAAQEGKSTLGLKPIASGAENGINDDAAKLKAASTLDLPMEQINPFCFKDPIAPHIAAEKAGVRLDAKTIAEAIKPSLGLADYTIIEGAGGLMVPLNEQETLVDLIKLLDIPVILVVGITLGCINHASLTDYVLQKEGITIAGWVANCHDKKMLVPDENLSTLSQRMSSSLLMST